MITISYKPETYTIASRTGYPALRKTAGVLIIIWRHKNSLKNNHVSHRTDGPAYLQISLNDGKHYSEYHFNGNYYKLTKGRRPL